ncbi:MAG TPA: hypothetical protein VJ815_04655 [Acidimicrobiia bacterium]|nr:hypothetical protein [Acidimicrobiia bacterium]
MTQTVTRRRDQESDIPPHPHYLLGTLTTIGIVATLVAVGLAIASLMITANRNSVDDTLVAGKVDTYLQTAGASSSVSLGRSAPETANLRANTGRSA